jgi:hypothetical protein
MVDESKRGKIIHKGKNIFEKGKNVFSISILILLWLSA